jgi:MFS family permease
MSLGGVLVDRLGAKDARRKLWLTATYSLVSSLLLIFAFSLSHSLLQLLLIGLGLAIAAGFAGPSGAIVASLTAPAIRASMLATLTLANNIFGLAPGPFVTGVLADGFGLETAFMLVPLTGLGAAAAFLIASLYYRNDLQRKVQLEFAR